MINFIRETFSEPDRKASFTRVFMGIIIGFAMYWGTIIVSATQKMPDLTGVGILLGVLYGINKAPAVADAVTDAIKVNAQIASEAK